jgi:thiamine kinase-like enzyme
VPAHVDGAAANFLRRPDGSLLLVDWEFSSMADPGWDVASILMQRAKDEDEPARRFAAAILDDAGERTMARLALFRAALTLVAGSWCAMEAAFRKDPDLAQTAQGYLERCAGLLADARMAQWMRAAAGA